jgi:hypothetical protein
MADLDVNSALACAATFPQRLDLRAFDEIVIPESARSCWIATGEAARDSVRHAPLAAAIGRALGRSNRVDGRLKRALAPVLIRPSGLISRCFARALQRFHQRRVVSRVVQR